MSEEIKFTEDEIKELKQLMVRETKEQKKLKEKLELVII